MESNVTFFAPEIKRILQSVTVLVVFFCSDSFAKIGDARSMDRVSHEFKPSILKGAETREYRFLNWNVKQAYISGKSVRIQYHCTDNAVGLDDLKWLLEREGDNIANWKKKSSDSTTLVSSEGHELMLIDKYTVQIDAKHVIGLDAAEPASFPWLLTVSATAIVSGTIIFLSRKVAIPFIKQRNTLKEIEALCDFEQRKL